MKGAELRYDLQERAENGLRRGYTTGTCATAAVKAALIHLLSGETPERINVSLIDGMHYLPVPIDNVSKIGTNRARAEVIKDAGDDPDQTHRARIWAEVCRNDSDAIHFVQGEGVGRVTQPGLRIGVGEPAINPDPRRMMERAVGEVLAEAEMAMIGFDLKIGCENGAAIAKRTFNPRLGIEGGISILGTTGIVEPKSLASFKASIEIYIRVALADSPEEIVLAPGNLGQRFSRTFLQLPLKQVVQMSNFAGFAFDAVEQTLAAGNRRLPRLWVVGHPGKLVKILADVWDTHSEHGPGAVAVLGRCAEELNLSESFRRAMAASISVEALIESSREQADVKKIWESIEAAIACRIKARFTRVDEVRVKLFELSGQGLSERV